MNQHKRFSDGWPGCKEWKSGSRGRRADKRQSHGRARAWLKRELLKLR